MGLAPERLRTCAAWLAVAAVAAGCERPTPEPVPGPASAPSATTSAATPSSAQPSQAEPGSQSGRAGQPPLDVAWDVPESWQRMPHPSPMRLATHRIPSADDTRPAGELTITRAGGSLQDNIRRWKGQFRLARERPSRRRQLTVNGVEVQVVELRGVYLGSRKPGTPVTRPKARWSMRVAVVPTAQGSLFFKVLGPQATVEAAGADFDVLLGSIRPR